MYRMRAAILLLPLAAMLSSTQAGSLRCGNDLIDTGDSVLAVKDACGKPDRRAALIGEDDDRVGTAFYYRLENKATRRVVFRGGRVSDIERLD